MIAVDVDWLDRYFVSAYTLDDNGVAMLSPVETATNGDSLTTIHGRYGSLRTTGATVATVPLPWSINDGSVWGFDVYVVAKGTNVRRRVKLSAIVYGDGADATIDGAPQVDAKGTGSATAAITVDGSTAFLTLTPGAAVDLTWGFEVRGQEL